MTLGGLVSSVGGVVALTLALCTLDSAMAIYRPLVVSENYEHTVWDGVWNEQKCRSCEVFADIYFSLLVKEAEKAGLDGALDDARSFGFTYEEHWDRMGSSEPEYAIAWKQYHPELKTMALANYHKYNRHWWAVFERAITLHSSLDGQFDSGTFHTTANFYNPAFAFKLKSIGCTHEPKFCGSKFTLHNDFLRLKKGHKRCNECKFVLNEVQHELFKLKIPVRKPLRRDILHNIMDMLCDDIIPMRIYDHEKLPDMVSTCYEIRDKLEDDVVEHFTQDPENGFVKSFRDLCPRLGRCKAGIHKYREVSALSNDIMQFD
eukprot:GFYU01011451.1.p1 GENE.GFYU01011451.1~~GFYU01011451.1.p1  ORF type:complete len:318 (-),score=68.88 GFYU01011451.1:136-1089(-)